MALDDTAYGQLDSDQEPDVALVIECDTADQWQRITGADTFDVNGHRRSLVVIIGSADGVFRRTVEAQSVMLTEREGGMMGDPFYGIQIERRTLVLSYWGGGIVKWSLTYRFRFQNDDWYLIGATQGGGNATQWHLYDWNLNTGILVIEEMFDEDPSMDRRLRLNVRPEAPIRMTSFQPWSLEPAPDITF